MKKIAQCIGRLLHILAWPAYQVYLRRTDRTRIALIDGDYILVAKNWISDGKWSLPGGGLHKGEDITAGALRELKEEMGLELNPERLTPHGLAEYRHAGLRYVFHIFEVKVRRTNLVIRPQRIEIAEARWVAMHTLNIRNAGLDLLLTVAKVRPDLLQ